MNVKLAETNMFKMDVWNFYFILKIHYEERSYVIESHNVRQSSLAVFFRRKSSTLNNFIDLIFNLYSNIQYQTSLCMVHAWFSNRICLVTLKFNTT